MCLGTAGSEPRWEVLEFEAGEEGRWMIGET